MVKPRENRVPIMMSEEELAAIDDWRFANRVATRSDAIRRLTAMGAALDSAVVGLNDQRVSMWNAYSASSDLVLNAAREGDVDWKSVALVAIRALGQLAEPQAILSHQLNALGEQAAVLRSSKTLAEAIRDVQSIESLARERVALLSKLYRESEGASS